MYFKNIKTVQEAKNLFKDLCKKLHPDTSGFDSQSEFIKMFNEFKGFKPTGENEENENFDASEFYNLIKKFDVLDNIQIHFVGSFIWLEDLEQGATYKQKEVLKSIVLGGYNSIRFASKKKLWYFSPIDYVQKCKSKKDFEQIKNAYGYESYKTKGISKIKA